MTRIKLEFRDEVEIEFAGHGRVRFRYGDDHLLIETFDLPSDPAGRGQVLYEQPIDAGRELEGS